MHGLSPWLAWLADGEFWSWVRTVLGTVLGALIAFVTGRLTQRQTSAEALKAQDRADATAARRDTESREHDSQMRARATVERDVRALLEEFSAVHREALDVKPTVTEVMNNVDWRPHWRIIWTDARSLRLDILATLVPDELARNELRLIVRLLDAAPDLSQESAFPGRLSHSLRDLTMSLAGSGVTTTAGYLRGEPFARSELGAAQRVLEKQQEWQANEEARAEQQWLAQVEEMEAHEAEEVRHAEEEADAAAAEGAEDEGPGRG